MYILTFQVLSRFSAKFIVLSRFYHFSAQIPGHFWTWTDKIQISRFSRFPGSAGNPIVRIPCTAPGDSPLTINILKKSPDLPKRSPRVSIWQVHKTNVILYYTCVSDLYDQIFTYQSKQLLMLKTQAFEYIWL